MQKFFLKNLWLWKCNLPEILLNDKNNLSLKEIEEVQWSNKFEKLQRNRMIMGFFRYGNLRKQKGRYNNIKSCIERLKLYQKTGNTEHLVDVANICMCEFVNGTHSKKHFKSEDDGIHAEIKGE